MYHRILSFLLAFISLQAGAQTLDQSNTTSSPPSNAVVSYNQFCYQSFTAGITGRLSKVEVMLNAYTCTGATSFPFTAQISEDFGSQSILVIENFSINLPFPTKMYTINFSNPPFVIAGKSYKLVLRGSSNHICSGVVMLSAYWSCSASDTYPKGNANVGGTNQAGDFYFNTYVIPTCSASVIDQAVTNGITTPYTVTFVDSLGQSFFPDVNGTLTAFSIEVSGGAACDQPALLTWLARIYEGNGASGKLLSTDTGKTYSNTDRQMLMLSLRKPVPVSRGRQYTIFLSAFSGKTCMQGSGYLANYLVWYGSASNSYANGNAWQNLIRKSAYDYSFITYVTSKTFSVTDTFVCKEYKTPDGKHTWTKTGTYTDTLKNYLGCDSIITVNLTVNDTTVSIHGDTLIANQPGAHYRWLDCGNGNNPIPGEQSQKFIATGNSSYAVHIINHECTATSPCIPVTWLPCGKTIDQTQTTGSNKDILSTNQSPGQSFTAGKTGSLLSMKLYWIFYQCDNPQFIRFMAEILEGDGFEGNVLAKQICLISAPYGPAWYSINFNVPAYVRKGKTYTLKLTPLNVTTCIYDPDEFPSAVKWYASSENIYPGGKAYKNGNPIDTADFQFITTVGTTSYNEIHATACREYKSPSGKYTWTESGYYTDILTASNNCDSIIYVALSMPDTSVTVSGNTLKARQDSAEYQWLKCDKGFKPIPLATSRTYKATAFGSYAVIVKKFGCSDTSSCKEIKPGLCSDIIDQANPETTPTGGMTAYEKQTIAQSFTAGITGLLKKVEILSIINQCTLGKDYTINFSLLEGDGITGKTLASASIKTTTPLNFGWLSYTFSVPPQINKGDMYTFQISVPPNQHCMLGRGDTLNLSFNSEIGSYDSYAGGCVYINSSKKTIFDLIFRTLVNPTTYSAITKNSCIAFTSPSGKIFSASGVYKDTLISSIACDSIITLNLTVVTDTAVTVNGKTLTSKQDGAIYQWVNCNLGYKPIPLATNKTYTSPGNGTYALIIKNGACTDTTGCKIIGTGGIPVISHAGISVFPNPVSGELYICLDAGIREMQFELHDLLGQVIASGKVNGTAVVSTAGISPGIYLLRLSSGATSTTIKILKE